jgi:hypothetical protein
MTYYLSLAGYECVFADVVINELFMYHFFKHMFAILPKLWYNMDNMIQII